MRFGMVAAAAAALVCAGQADAAGLILVDEVEPNNSIATAQALPVSLQNAVRVTATLDGAGFENSDFFSFVVDNANCGGSQPLCNFITVVASSNFALGSPAPYISLFDPRGVNLVVGQADGASVSGVAAGTYTIGVRRSSANSLPDYRLVVSVAATAPEPATWAMMMLGIGIVGYAMRRRQPRVSFGLHQV